MPWSELAGDGACEAAHQSGDRVVEAEMGAIGDADDRSRVALSIGDLADPQYTHATGPLGQILFQALGDGHAFGGPFGDLQAGYDAVGDVVDRAPGYRLRRGAWQGACDDGTAIFGCRPAAEGTAPPNKALPKPELHIATRLELPPLRAGRRQPVDRSCCGLGRRWSAG